MIEVGNRRNRTAEKVVGSFAIQSIELRSIDTGIHKNRTGFGNPAQFTARHANSKVVIAVTVEVAHSGYRPAQMIELIRTLVLVNQCPGRTGINKGFACSTCASNIGIGSADEHVVHTVAVDVTGIGNRLAQVVASGRMVLVQDRSIRTRVSKGRTIASAAIDGPDQNVRHPILIQIASTGDRRTEKAQTLRANPFLNQISGGTGMHGDAAKHRPIVLRMANGVIRHAIQIHIPNRSDRPPSPICMDNSFMAAQHRLSCSRINIGHTVLPQRRALKVCPNNEFRHTISIKVTNASHRSPEPRI